jgi:hypothetical protein
MGVADRALRLLDQSRGAFASADLAHAPGWAVFFDKTDLSAMVGTVHAELAQTVHTRHTGSAIPALSHAAVGYPEDMARSKTFTLISLATCHLLDGDVDLAITIGSQAVELATTLASSARRADASPPTPGRQAPRQRGCRRALRSSTRHRFASPAAGRSRRAVPSAPARTPNSAAPRSYPQGRP